jgi:hypothetical protein
MVMRLLGKVPPELSEHEATGSEPDHLATQEVVQPSADKGSVSTS